MRAPAARGGAAGATRFTVRDEGWTGQRNGALLRLMQAAGFATLVTVDRNLTYQQNVAAAGVAVIVHHARSSRTRDLAPLIPLCSKPSK